MNYIIEKMGSVEDAVSHLVLIRITNTDGHPHIVQAISVMLYKRYLRRGEQRHDYSKVDHRNNDRSGQEQPSSRSVS